MRIVRINIQSVDLNIVSEAYSQRIRCTYPCTLRCDCGRGRSGLVGLIHARTLRFVRLAAIRRGSFVPFVRAGDFDDLVIIFIAVDISEPRSYLLSENKWK
jgi:hypothetical protein